MKEKIAVIGMSFQLPEAETREQLHWNLMRKKVSVRDVSDARKQLANGAVPDALQLAAVEDLALFDNSFFEISNREARAMCPEARLSLTHAAKAILDAGYALSAFRGSVCGVIVSQSDSNYQLGETQRDGFTFTGNLPAMTAGNIAYYLDLRGPNLTLSSACASTLASVHEAVWKLRLHEADWMLVGGAELAQIDRGSVEEVRASGIVSNTNCCHAFDQCADGMISGDGAGFLLLKRYEDAVRDGDHIYGCILSSAMNGNGARSGNPTAPSAEAEAEVVRRAWEAADLTSDDITEIEAHGTGTIVGDPIEAEGIQRCMTGNHREHPLYVSALKSNVGHLGNVAGFAALVKVLTGFEHHVCYPIAGLQTLNPAISADGVEFVKEPVLYTPEEKRIAGISAFAFNGTNVHVVVENQLPQETKSNWDASQEYVLKISAKEESALELYLQEIYKTLRDTREDFMDCVATLNLGRDDFACRGAVTFRTKEECLQKLCSCAVHRCPKHGGVALCGENAEEMTARLANCGVALVKPEQAEVQIAADGKSVAQLFAACYCSGAEVDWKRYFAGVSFHRVSLPCDNMTKKLFWHKTKGTEEIAASAPAAPVAVETEKPAEAPAIPAAPEELEAPQSMEEHLLQIFRSGLEDDTLQAEDSIFDAGANSMTLLTLIDDLKDAGITLELAEFYQYDSAAKLAEYLESGQPAADAAAEEVPTPAEKTAEPQDLVQVLLEACRSGLDDDTLTEDDSLFDAGINSMSMMMVIDDLEEQGLTLKLADFYDCETVRELAARMETQKGTV